MTFFLCLHLALLLSSNTTCLEKSTNLMPASENVEASSSNASSNARKFVTLVLSDGLHYQVSPDDSLALFSGLIKKKFSTHPGGTITLASSPVSKTALSHIKKLIKSSDRTKYLTNLRDKNPGEYEGVICAVDYLQGKEEILNFHVDPLWNYMVTAEGKQKLKDFCAQQNNFPLCKKMLEEKIRKYPYVAQYTTIAPVDCPNAQCLLEYSSGGDSIAVAVPDKGSIITVHYPSDPGKKRTLDNISVPIALQYSPIAKHLLAIASKDATIKILDLEKTNTTKLRTGYGKDCYNASSCLAYTEDGNHLAGSYKKPDETPLNLFIFDARSHMPTPIPYKDDADITSLCWSAPYLLAGLKTGHVSVIDIRVMKEIHNNRIQAHNKMKQVQPIYKIQRDPSCTDRVALENHLYNCKTNIIEATIKDDYENNPMLNFTRDGYMIKCNGTMTSVVNTAGKKFASWRYSCIKSLAVNPTKKFTDGLEMAAIMYPALRHEENFSYNLVVCKTHKIPTTRAIEAYNAL
jgi:WD40 repeat protein